MLSLKAGVSGGPKTQNIYLSPFRLNEDIYRTASGTDPFDFGVYVFSSRHKQSYILFSDRNYKYMRTAEIVL